MATMDPGAALPRGEPLLLAQARAAAPISQYFRTMAPSGLRPLRPKALRAPKERLPVAAAVDPQQVRNLPPSSAQLAPTAPAPAAPAGAFTFPGGRHTRTSIPPDTAGAVGRTHVFHPLNNRIWFHDRLGTQLVDLPLDAFWSALVAQQVDAFDPKTVYDHEHDRFVFVSVANAHSPTSALLIAVSDTSDPTQTWVGHMVTVDDATQGPVWLDYPSLGFTADKVTAQVNLFRRDNNRFAGSTIYVFDKSSLYAGTPALQRFVLADQGGTQVPATTYVVGFKDQLLAARWTGNAENSGYLAIYRIAGNAAAGTATLARVGFISSGPSTWDSFPPGPTGDFGPQLGIPQTVSVNDDRILGVCLRSDVLYCAHTVMLPAGGATRSAVQWWEIDAAAWRLRALGRIDDPSNQVFYAFPTIAANRNQDVALGFGQFSSAIHPSAAYALKTSGGSMGAPVVFAPGRATYFETNGGASNRWGDYSATMVDPVDDTAFWTVQEFADTPADTWATMWAKFPVPPPAIV